MVLLFAAEPRRLMLGYLLGAYLASMGLGIVIVFALPDSGAVHTAKNGVSPAVDIVLGLLLILVAFVVHGNRDARLRERRRARAEAKGPKKTPAWRKALDKGTASAAFVVGIVLTLPGASYLAGMSRISKADASNSLTVLAVVGFCLIMLMLIEIPLLGFVVAPDWTRRAVKRFTDWVSGNARTIVTRVAGGAGSLLLVRAAIELLS
jgi:hypothetical protein